MAYQAQPPAGLLQPLLVPHCPWSLWFPWTLSQICPSGDTTILTIDRFSKMVHFVPLPELQQRGLLHHVFSLYGFPRDVVSDRGATVRVMFLEDFLHLPSSHHQSVLGVPLSV